MSNIRSYKMSDHIKNIFYTIACSLTICLSSGCESESLEKNAPNKTVKEDFTIAGCHIFYKGQELPPFTGTKAEQAPTLESWISILGENYNNKYSSDIYVWKEQGFRIYTRADAPDRVQTLAIIKHVDKPRHIDLMEASKDPEGIKTFGQGYADELRAEAIKAEQKGSISPRIPHPNPIWFNGVIIEDHFNKELFNQQMALYRQKLHDGYESPWGQGSGSQFFEGYSVWRQSSFSKCEGDWGFETLIRVEQKFAPDDVISAINIGPDR